jgi:hypothetical protein
VLVSHDVETIRRLCARVVWLDAGAVRLEGLAHEVVASYLGETPADAHFDPAEGEGHPEITAVHFFGPAGPTGTVETGDPLTIRVSYRSGRAVTNASCAISCFRADNDAYVFGQLSTQGGLPLTMFGDGQVEFRIPHLPLLAGHYEVSVALLDETLRTIFDWHERRHSFVVVSNLRVQPAAGMVYVAGRWAVPDSSAVA